MNAQAPILQRIRLIAVGLSLAWAVSAPAAANAAEPNQNASARVRVVPDVSYGPDPRNVMDLYLPEALPAPRPLVLCIHGGGWAGGDKRVYAWLAEALAQRGYAAASVTYRFAPAARAPAQMDDVQRAVRFLRKNATKYEIDPGRSDGTIPISGGPT